jgi:hypothetical protein
MVPTNGQQSRIMGTRVALLGAIQGKRFVFHLLRRLAGKSGDSESVGFLRFLATSPAWKAIICYFVVAWSNSTSKERINMFKGILITRDEAGYRAQLQDIDDAVLPAGDVSVRVEWSTLNYKDGLAITGKAPVVRRFPMVPGIDLAGTVIESSNPAWKVGDQVLLNGWGVGETHCGGLARTGAGARANGWCRCRRS